jgi:hypothetical protein
VAAHDDARNEARRLELEEELRWMRAMRRRDNLRMLAGIVASLVIAIPMMAMSAHVTSVEEGRVWLYGGLVIGDAGVLASVGWGLWRSVERGETRW